MPKVARELSSTEVRRIKRPGMHAVGGVRGLYIDVKPTGARSWILRMKVGDRQRHFGLGSFPTVTLEQARQRAREARDLVWQGIDPIAARRAAQDALRAANAKRLTFDQAAKQCHAAKAHEFRSARHRQNWLNSLTMYASPVIGSMPVDQIEQPHVLKVLQPIWTTKTETARRVRQRIEAVLSWAAVSRHRSGDNPARWDGNLEHALARPSKVRKVKHYPALPWQEIGDFMADLRAREGMGARRIGVPDSDGGALR
jgi:hypothetical protein